MEAVKMCDNGTSANQEAIPKRNSDKFCNSSCEGIQYVVRQPDRGRNTDLRLLEKAELQQVSRR